MYFSPIILKFEILMILVHKIILLNIFLKIINIYKKCHRGKVMVNISKLMRVHNLKYKYGNLITLKVLRTLLPNVIDIKLIDWVWINHATTQGFMNASKYYFHTFWTTHVTRVIGEKLRSWFSEFI